MSDAPLNSFDDITARLDDIVDAVRSRDTSLERSLDLFDEAIELGSRAVEMVDSFELSPREADLLEDACADGSDAGAAAPAPEAEGGAPAADAAEPGGGA